MRGPPQTWPCVPPLNPLSSLESRPYVLYKLCSLGKLRPMHLIFFALLSTTSHPTCTAHCSSASGF